MVNITHKSNSLRQAIAIATVVVSKIETIEAANERKVPKGDIFEFSRAAGLLAIKKTSDTIPDCHPLPIEFAVFTYETEGLQLHIKAEVHTIYKTGVEVEAMHGAAVAALTVYDMLKPIDKGVYISTIKLVSKKGGKTDFSDQQVAGLKSVVIVCSDSVIKGIKEDTAGLKVVEKLKKNNIEIIDYTTIPDDFELIQQKAKAYANTDCNLLVFVGGTGLSPRDITPDAIKPLLTREIPGVMETARSYGQERMPYAMLSRGVCGFINNTLVITLPGSPKGAAETMEALFPYILHVFKVAEGMRHD
ncbi:MAG: bifunctional molybdenum cofactor biosynthesis protein MoaC/MoaB [Ferruginibacter sp.]